MAEFSVIEFQTRPIDQWPGKLTPHHARKRSPFSVQYGVLNRDLMRELEHIQATAVVVLMALRDDEIRLDGRPRGNAKPSHPGVILSWHTKDGPFRMACDTYDTWTGNLRAITLTLKNLRLIDNYGCTKRGEQYRGWAALPAPDGTATTLDEARKVIASAAVRTVNWSDADDVRSAFREAAHTSHPDTGGNAESFKRFMAAKNFIETNRQ